jgi:hypothetical protein
VAITDANAPSVWHDLPVVLARFLRLPLALGIMLGLTAAPVEAQLWKPSKKKPATAIKAKSKPAPRKVGKPTKRKPKSARVRKKAPPPAPVASDDVDDAPIITIYPGDDED